MGDFLRVGVYLAIVTVGLLVRPISLYVILRSLKHPLLLVGRSLAHWIRTRLVQTSRPSLYCQSRDPDRPPRLLCDQARRICGSCQGHPAVHELCRVSDALSFESQELMKVFSILPTLFGIAIATGIAITNLLPHLTGFSSTPLGRFLILVEMVRPLLSPLSSI